MLQSGRLPGVILCTPIGPVVHFEEQNGAGCSDSPDCIRAGMGLVSTHTSRSMGAKSPGMAYSVEKLEIQRKTNFSQNLFFSKVRFKSCV